MFFPEFSPNDCVLATDSSAIDASDFSVCNFNDCENMIKKCALYLIDGGKTFKEPPKLTGKGLLIFLPQHRKRNSSHIIKKIENGIPFLPIIMPLSNVSILSCQVSMSIMISF